MFKRNQGHQVVRQGLLLILMTAVLSACGKTAETSNEVKKSGDVGPVEVVFQADQLFQNQLDIDINQTAGTLDYVLSPGPEMAVEVVNMKATMQGCPASQPQLEVLYLADATNTVGLILSTGKVVRTQENTRGKIVFQYTNLTGCTHLHQEFVLKKIPILLNKTQQGLWETVKTTSTTTSRLSLRFDEWGPRDVRVAYVASCDDLESFEGRVVETDLTTKPQRMMIEITRVTNVAGRFCSNLMFFGSGAAGQKLACVFEKVGSGPQFQWGCQRPSYSPSYPTSFASAEIYWSQK